MNGEKVNKKYLTNKEFIQQVFIREIITIASNNKFLSFLLISSAIEALGVFLDNPKEPKDIFKKRNSKIRFRKAINELFPDIYKKHNNGGDFDLYNQLRCGFAHSMVPGPKIGVSEIAHGTKHLSIVNNILVIVSENFCEDFKKACEKVIEKIENGEIKEIPFLAHP